MTDDELRRRIDALGEQIEKVSQRVEENGDMTRQMHTDLYKKRPGDLKDEKPLMEAMREVVRTFNRSKWAARVVTWLAGAGAAIATLYFQWVRSGK